MDYKNIYYPESKFGGFTEIDGTMAFYIRVNSLVNPSSVVLDIGCGRGAYGDDPVPIRKELRIFKGRAKKVIGIDVDPGAQTNPFLDEFRLIEERRWPVEDESVDLCVCDSVLEHVDDPELFFSECRRVLKPGGFLCIRTTNAWSYIGLFSRLIPNRFHARILRKVQATKIKKEDVFPTLYKANSTRRIRYMLDKYGFDNCVYGHEPEPGYLYFSRFLYLLGVTYQKFAPGFLKATIFAFGKKISQV